MPGASKVLQQRLQVLQSDRVLEAPPACLGKTGLPDFPPRELLEGIEGADRAQLLEVVRKAQFWISLLEGEHCELTEEIAKHKRRHQLAQRQADAKAVELKEVEGEKKRLLSEVKWLQESRDQAICERHLLREDKTKMTQQTKSSAETAETREKQMEDELVHLRDDKAMLEAELVRVKVRQAETLQRCDTMEFLIEFYEDQLKALSPSFEPADLSTLGQWRRPSRLDDDELRSNASERHEKESVAPEEHKKTHIAKGISKMFKGGISKLSKKSKHKDHEKEHSDEPQSSPRETPTPRQPTTTPRQPSVTPRQPSVTPRQPAPAPSPSPRDAAAPAATPPEGATATPPVAQEATSPESPTSAGAASSPARARRRWEMRTED